MVAAYSPQARGHSERLFRTLRDRLPNELEEAGITAMAAANRFLAQQFWPAFNRRFQVPASEAGSAFVPVLCTPLDDILCPKAERTVRRDNCANYGGKVLQIPKTGGRCHYVKASVQVHEYRDGRLAIWHGPRKLAVYEATGELATQAAGPVIEDAA